MTSEKEKTFKRRLDGVVVSDKNDKTIIVKSTRRFKHPKYSKYLHENKKFHAHDESNIAKIGDKVEIIESRPRSKQKVWELARVYN